MYVINERPILFVRFTEYFKILKSSTFLFLNSVLNSLYDQYLNFYYVGNLSSKDLVLYNRSDYIVQYSMRGLGGIVNRVVFAHFARIESAKTEVKIFSVNLIISITLSMALLIYFLGIYTTCHS